MRRAAVPIVALAAVLAVGLALPFSTPFALVALWPLYLVARDEGPRAAAIGVAALGLAVLVHDAAWAGEVQLPALLISLALGGAAAAFGHAAGTRRAAGARERELLAERAAAEERMRIARELHDAVGHDVSLMVVQAQALGATATDPAVREGTDAIAALGRRTMDAMHRTLLVLRGDAARDPQPSLDAIAEVLDGVRSTGVALTYAVEGAPRPLPPALDASAFRIVQEAVTNVVRHAGGAPAAVTVRYGADALELVVRDDGPGPRADGTPGHGLVGMRERAGLLGGTLEAGPRDGRGFEVHAVLPYEAAA
jgi:signal transduction histidine kinase